MKILIIGGGNMGKTYADSFTANQTITKENLYILNHSQEKADYFKMQGFQNSFIAVGDYISEMNLIILAIKPQDAKVFYPILLPFLKEKQLLLSIMAGVTMKGIEENLPLVRVVRAMPNLPTQIGMGITGFTAAAQVTREELFMIQNLLNTTGKSIYFEDENKLDAVTAISGSGPAYVYYFMESMISTAKDMGFSAAEAELLVEQTFMGAVHLKNIHQLSCAEWIAKVASKGGTTEAALKTFAQFEVKGNIGKGLNNALKRAKELGN